MKTEVTARLPRALALLLLLVAACSAADARAVGVYSRSARFPVSLASEEPQDERFSAEQARDAERNWVRGCPCHAWHEQATASRLCLPVAVTQSWAGPAKRKEVFAFSTASDDRWKRYDWDLVRSPWSIRAIDEALTLETALVAGVG